MKKHLLVLVVTVMVSTGLVLAVGGTASAHCALSQYSGCVRTVTKLKATKRVPLGDRATICVTVSSEAGEALPTGVVQLAIRKRHSTKVVRRDLEYLGTKTCFRTRKYVEKALYKVTAVYESPSGSIFYNSADRTRFTVQPPA